MITKPSKAVKIKRKLSQSRLKDLISALNGKYNPRSQSGFKNS